MLGKLRQNSVKLSQFHIKTKQKKYLAMKWPVQHKHRWETYLRVRHLHHLLEVCDPVLHCCKRLWQLVEVVLLLHTKPAHYRGPNCEGTDEQQSWWSIWLYLSSRLLYWRLQQNWGVFLLLFWLSLGHGSRWRSGRTWRAVCLQWNGFSKEASPLDLLRYHVFYSARPSDLVIHWTPITLKATAAGGGRDSILCNCSGGRNIQK